MEETVSFYTRNDYSILNSLLTGTHTKLWEDARLAYGDNRGIVQEYEQGIREIATDYDVRWLNSLRKRLIDGLDEPAKAIILENARNDIANLLRAMGPAPSPLHLYRTAWVDREACAPGSFPFSREYTSLDFGPGDIVEIKGITSFSVTPYREDAEHGNPFFRYEMAVPQGAPILELDAFITHNEDGEVLLPPMAFRVVGIHESEKKNCMGVIRAEYVRALP